MTPSGSSSGSIPPPGTIHWSGYRLLLTNRTCKPDHNCETPTPEVLGHSHLFVHATAAELGNFNIESCKPHKTYKILFVLYRKLCKSRSRTALSLKCVHSYKTNEKPHTLLIQSSILPVHFLTVSETSNIHPCK